jgi:hypothetical protein
MVCWETESGKFFERIVGAITFVETDVAADRMRSVSTRTLGNFGTMEARTATTSSGPSLPAEMVRRSPSILAVFSDDPLRFDSEKDSGRVVKRAVRSLRNRSCINVSYS